MPSGRCVAGTDQGEPLGDAGEFCCLLRAGNDVADAAAFEPVEQIGLGQQGGGRDHHGTQLYRRQHGLPQRDDITEHQQDAVAALHAERAQAVGDAVGAFRQFSEGDFGGAVTDDLQRGSLRRFAAGEFGIEPVERPVEAVERGPAERPAGCLVIGAMGQQTVARRLERRRGHLPLPVVSADLAAVLPRQPAENY